MNTWVMGRYCCGTRAVDQLKPQANQLASNVRPHITMTDDDTSTKWEVMETLQPACYPSSTSKYIEPLSVALSSRAPPITPQPTLSSTS
jgi:hypothetical protein